MELKLPHLILATSVVCVLLIIDIFLRNQRRWEKLPPGPRKLPLIGNLHQLAAGGALPWRTFQKLARKHGPIMHLQLGQVSTVVVSSPRLAKEVLQTHDLSFLDRPELFGSKILFHNRSDIGFSPYGDFWRQMRKLCAVELLSSIKVTSYGSIREKEASGLVALIRTSSSTGSPVNISKKLFWLSNTITCRTAFGSKFNGQEELIPMVGNVLELFGGLNVADVFPSLDFLNFVTGTKSKLRRTHKIVDSVIDDMIHDYKSNWLESRKGRSKPTDAEKDENLLDALIRLQQSTAAAGGGGSQFDLTDTNIKSVIFDLFVAGTDPSATVVEWGLSEMLKNPRVMRKAQAEVRQVVGDQNKRDVKEIDIPRLKYLKMVVKETLRLYPPAPLLVPRECREACEIDGYTIPLKTRVLVNVWAIGRDPDVWDDAETFKPERFENSSIDFKGNDFELIPFSAGRRMCPGLSFGISISELVLAKLLYHFDWKLPQETDLNMEESFGLVARRKHELYVIPISFQG